MSVTFKAQPASQVIKNLSLEEKGKVQTFLDNEVVRYLQSYVTFQYGTQSQSIRLQTVCGTGEIKIGVPYAHYQAYSDKVRERDPKDPRRGKQPWERMNAEQGQKIFQSLENYVKGINHG